MEVLRCSSCDEPTSAEAGAKVVKSDALCLRCQREALQTDPRVVYGAPRGRRRQRRSASSDPRLGRPS